MGFVESVKGMLGFGSYEDEYEEDYECEEEVEEEEAPKESIFSRKSSKVVSIAPQTQTKIVVLKPKCFNNSTHIADELRKKRPVIVDVGTLDPEEARRIVDFVSGTVYGLDGKLQKITSGIFVATPSRVDILGEVFKEDTATAFAAF